MKRQKVSALLLALCMALGGTMTAFADEVPNAEQQPAAVESVQEETAEQASEQAGETAEAANEDGFVIEDGVLVKYEGTASDVVIPAGVISIGKYAFSGSQVNRVKIPEGVESIGESAFMHCRSLNSVELPESLKSIGRQAFFMCGLVNVTIPDGVTEIEGEAFSNNYSLKSINVPKGVQIIKDSVFNSCYALESLDISMGVTSIEFAAFGGCTSLKNLTIPASVTTIAFNAFAVCPELVVNIPDSVTDITYSNSIVSDPGHASYIYPYATICTKEGSCFWDFAKEYGIRLVRKNEDGTTTAEETTSYPLVLIEGYSTITSDSLEELVEINKTQSVAITAPNGVVFTFAKGSMKMINGKTEYDFGTEVITDYAKVGKVPFSADETAFRVNYNYDGELPGTASITIPVDKKWNGQTLFYYQLMDDGKVELKQSAVVTNGTYTIPQNHCSDYIASTKELKSVNAPAETAPKTSPKTGDAASVSVLISMMGLAGTIILRRAKNN